MDKQDVHLTDILLGYLKKENYQFDTQDFRLQLLSNPTYPSVKSITDTLDYFGVKNLAAQVPPEALAQLPKTFLTVLKKGPLSLIAQVHQQKETVKLHKSNGEQEILNPSDFKKNWEGTIIAIEANQAEKKKLFNSGSSLLTMILLSFLALLFLGGNFSNGALGYTLLAVLGSMFSYLILREELGFVNDLTSRICNSSSLNTNCSAVIGSTSAHLFNKVKFSDLSLSFFLSQLLWIAFLGIDPAFFLLIGLMSIPLIVYSLYLQAFVLKQWCPLCLAIAAITLGFNGILLAGGIPELALDATYFLTASLISVLIFCSWLFFKSLLINSQELQKDQINYFRFKRNESLFYKLLSQNPFPRIKELSSEAKIQFGNPHAPLKITAVSNPLCGYCATALASYQKIRETHPDQVQFQLIFHVSSGKLREVESQIIHKVIELYKEEAALGWKALQQWFELKSLKPWQGIYGISEKTEFLDIIQEQRAWCKTHQISYTPTTIIGDHCFPIEYDIEDLSLFIDSLIEQAENETQKEQLSL